MILFRFFHNFIHVQSPKAGADNPQGTEFQIKLFDIMATNASFKETSLNCEIIHIFSDDFIQVDGSGAGTDHPWGTEF